MTTIHAVRLITVRESQRDGTEDVSHFSVCSCGWVSLPTYRTADLERCPIDEALAERDQHRRLYPHIVALVEEVA